MAEINKPFANTALVKVLDKAIYDYQRQHPANSSLRELAQKMGYKNGNILSMYRLGDAKVPLEKVPEIARLFGIDTAFLFRCALEQYWPEGKTELARMFGRAQMTQNEFQILDYIRKVSEGSDPKFTDALKDAITGALMTKVPA